VAAVANSWDMPIAALAAMPMVFSVVFLAELPDKSTLSSLALATRKPPLWVWLGAAVAFLLQTALAVAAGSLLALVPPGVVRLVSGLCFLVFAVLMWRRRAEPSPTEVAAARRVEGEGAFWRVVGESAALVFAAEFGDLTQFAIAALEARLHQPLAVGAAAWLGLVAAAFLAVAVGGRLGTLASPGRVQRAAAVVFGAVGVGVLLGLHPGGI
jgi:putative Ca2+/H+ antiporter (TMEM165/GDT1 family)